VLIDGVHFSSSITRQGGWSFVAVARWSRSMKLTYVGPGGTGMNDHVRVQFPVQYISVCNQPPKSTQPGHPLVGRRSEYQPKGGDALRLGSKGRYGSCVGGR